MPESRVPTWCHSVKSPDGAYVEFACELNGNDDEHRLAIFSNYITRELEKEGLSFDRVHVQQAIRYSDDNPQGLATAIPSGGARRLVVRFAYPANVEEPRHLPGRRLIRWLRRLLPKSSCDRMLEPVIADTQYEYLEALRAGQLGLARFIWLRMYFLLVPGWLYVLAIRGVIWLFSA